MKIAVLTDSTSIIDPQIKRKLNIKVLPLPLLVNGKTYYEKYYHDYVELKNDLGKSQCFLSAGQVSVEALQEIVDDLIEKGYTDVICVHIDDSISGLGSNLRSFAIKQRNKINIHLVDSYSFGIIEGKLTQLVGEWVAAGEDWQTIKPKILQARNKMHTLVIMKNLKHISTTGYIKNGVSSVEKTLLNPKTLLCFGQDGCLEVTNTFSQYGRLFKEVQREIAPAYQEMAGDLKISIMMIQNKRNRQIISKLIILLKRVYPVAKIDMHEMPLSMIAHIGEQSIVVSWN